MKIIPRALALLATFAACQLGQADTNQPSEVEMLRSEIARQELVLSALKDKLAKLELDQKAKPNQVSLTLQANGDIIYGSKQITKEQLTEKLAGLPKDTQVKINVASTTEHKKVIEVTQLCHKAGIAKILFSTVETRTVAP